MIVADLPARCFWVTVRLPDGVLLAPDEADPEPLRIPAERQGPDYKPRRRKARELEPEVRPGRVFVALCDGAWLTGNPLDCTCDSYRTRLDELHAELGRLRVRAAVAEGARDTARERTRSERHAIARAWARVREANAALRRDPVPRVTAEGLDAAAGRPRTGAP